MGVDLRHRAACPPRLRPLSKASTKSPPPSRSVNSISSPGHTWVCGRSRLPERQELVRSERSAASAAQAVRAQQARRGGRDHQNGVAPYRLIGGERRTCHVSEPQIHCHASKADSPPCADFLGN